MCRATHQVRLAGAIKFVARVVCQARTHASKSTSVMRWSPPPAAAIRFQEQGSIVHQDVHPPERLDCLLRQNRHRIRLGQITLDECMTGPRRLSNSS